MTKYKVIIEPTAENDLRDLVRYITEALKAPATAKRIYASLK